MEADGGRYPISGVVEDDAVSERLAVFAGVVRNLLGLVGHGG